MDKEKYDAGQGRTEKHAKHPKKRRVRKKAVLIIVCALLILIAGGAAMAGLSINPPSLDKHAKTDDTQMEEREDGIYNVLVVGTDKVGLNTDTIMVMSLDSVNNRANVMSIPRDTMSNVKRSVKKINSAYAIGAKKGKGNIDNLKEEVSYLMGFEVDNYAVVNLGAFEEIIDAIGGVTIDVQRDMNYDDPYQDLHIHLKKGEQTLNGEQAIGFVRYRKGYAEGDLGRVKAQQQFIEAVANQLASPSTITKVPKLAEIVLRNMDTDLTNGEILWFAKEAMEIDMSTNLNMFVLPGHAQMVNRLSYYLPDEAEILTIVNEYFNPYATPITSLNIVNVGNVVQKEQERQSHLTTEQRREEQQLQEQLERETEMGINQPLPLEPDGEQGTEQPTTGNGENNNDNSNNNNNGQTGTETQPPQTGNEHNGNQGTTSTENPPADNSNNQQPENNTSNNNSNTENNTTPTNPDNNNGQTSTGTDNSGYNTIPGEVLKPGA